MAGAAVAYTKAIQNSPSKQMGNEGTFPIISMLRSTRADGEFSHSHRGFSPVIIGPASTRNRSKRFPAQPPAWGHRAKATGV